MFSHSNEVSNYSDDLTEASDKIDPVQVAKVMEYLQEEKNRSPIFTGCSGVPAITRILASTLVVVVRRHAEFLSAELR